METTLTLDKDVAMKVESEMLLSGKSLNDTLNEMLRVAIEAKSKEKPLAPFKVRPFSLGVKPGFNFDKPWELIEQIEGPLYK